MSEFLKKINKAGLIEKLDGEDERFTKMETAAEKVAQSLREEPPLLIRMVLAGLDPEIPADDPAIEMAEKALIDEWMSLRSVHPDSPIFIYRAIILDACDQVAEEKNAVILWNTVADTLPLMRLGKEETVVREMLMAWAQRAEEFVLVVPSLGEIKRAPVTKKIEPFSFELPTTKQVNKDNLKQAIAAATGPNYRSEAAIEGANPYWSQQQQHWSWEFTDRMTDLLSLRLNNIYKNIVENQTVLANQVSEHDKELLKSIKELLGAQRSWLQDVVKGSEKNRKAEHLRLNTLWWCETLYSPSLCLSYREIEPVLASILMALDLLDGLETPTPASVGYALAETVNKLPEMTFEKEYDLCDVLGELASKQTGFPATLIDNLSSPPETGRLSLRDMLISVIQGDSSKPEKLMKRAGISGDHKISLPRFAQALFRQEQAVRLAEGG